MISKELLENVLDTPIREVGEQQGSYILYGEHRNSFRSKVNIYELANLCKEWAKDYSFILSTKLYENTHYAKVRFKDEARYFSVEYEPLVSDVKVIFKACEYILKEKKWK